MGWSDLVFCREYWTDTSGNNVAPCQSLLREEIFFSLDQVLFIVLITFIIATLFGGVPRWKARWATFRVWFPPKDKAPKETKTAFTGTVSMPGGADFPSRQKRRKSNLPPGWDQRIQRKYPEKENPRPKPSPTPTPITKDPKTAKTERKKIKCSACGERTGHNKATCPKKRKKAAKKSKGYSGWNDYQKDSKNHIFFRSGPRKGKLNQKAMAKAYREDAAKRLKGE